MFLSGSGQLSSLSFAFAEERGTDNIGCLHRSPSFLRQRINARLGVALAVR